MRISLSGSTGFIGGKLLEKFSGTDWQFTIMNRDSFALDDDAFIEQKIRGADVVINLAGAPVAHRWTESYKQEIYRSRIDPAQKIARCIIRSQEKPKLFISASAIGIYDTIHTHTEESRDFASDFLGKVCMDWEKEAMTAKDATRVVVLRTGVVLDRDKGALASMHKMFSIGLGGTIGDGKQPFSWIHIRDLLSMIEFIVKNDDITGVVNAVAPNPTTNSHFTKTYGKVLLQPAIMKVPPFALKALYGEGASFLLNGQAVIPEKLLNHGFGFEFMTIESALLNIYRI
jgi:uncharacterized protein